MDGRSFRSRRQATTRPTALAEAMPGPPMEVPVRLAPIEALRRPSTAAQLEDVYEREHLDLFRFIKGMVRDQETAEDILQEAFLRLLGVLRAGDQPENAHAWLYRVALNLAISRARRSRTMVRHLPELVSRLDVTSPEQWALRAERDEALRIALDALPVETRAAVVLASAGFSAREIGSIVGKSEGAVRMLVSRGRLRIRRHLAAADVARTGGEAS